PSLLSTSSTLRRRRDAGIETFDLLRICALWMRAIMSPRGSFTAIIQSPLPARLDETGYQAPRAQLAQRNAGDFELAVEPARASRHFATIANTATGRIAGQFREPKRCGKSLLHRFVLVARNSPESRAPARIFLAQPLPPFVLF